jgi:hypothetical protein
MKHTIYILAALLMHLAPALAEDRAIANTTDSQKFEITAFEFSARSFFEPKTEADLTAMVALDTELESSLGQEELN